MLKYGIIKEIEGTNAKVRFDDLGTTSGWLQICQNGSHKTKSQDVPDIGTKVACIMDDNLEDGCVIGAIYTDEETPCDRDNTKIIRMLENSFIWIIDRAKGIFSTVFKEILVDTDNMEIYSPKIKINGVDLITYINNHVHTDGNQGKPTGKPTEELPSE